MQLVSNFHAYVWEGGDNNCNSYLFASVLAEGKHVLIDPGHVVTPAAREPGLAQLREQMEADGLDPGQIGLTLITHCHPDHSEGANVLRDEVGALTSIHEAEAGIFQQFGGEVDLLLREGELNLGTPPTLDLDVLHTPGHSPGHVCFYWPKERVLVAGDLIFYRSHGRVDLPGGDARALAQSIKRLAELEVDYLVCGHAYGHSGVIEGREAVQENFTFLLENVLY